MLVQLCYASRRIEFENNLLQDLSDILVKARTFNHAQEIYGVLYYAEGIYFQCLEGESEVLEALFSKISQDPRHHDIQRFADRKIEKIHFSEWSMKYVNQHGKVSKFFEKQDLKQFEPHKLSATNITGFLDVLLKLQGSEEPIKNRMGLNHRGYQNFF